MQTLRRKVASARPLKQAARPRVPLWVKLRNTRNEQIFSALPPITDILGGRVAKLSSGGREYFHSISNMVSALPAPEQADKGLQSPCRLETGKFSTHSLSTTISRLRMNGRFARLFKVDQFTRRVMEAGGISAYDELRAQLRFNPMDTMTGAKRSNSSSTRR